MSSHRQGSENGAVDATEESVRGIETSSTGGKVDESSNSSEETEKYEKSEKSSTAGGRKFPIIPIKLPGWTIWAIGSLILLAIPIHKGIIKFDGKLGRRVIGAVIDEVQAVAPLVKKIAGGIADFLPEDCKLAQDLEFIENLAEDAEESADNVEDLIDKVEDIRDVIEDVIELAEVIEPMVENVIEFIEVFEPLMEEKSEKNNNNSKIKSR